VRAVPRLCIEYPGICLTTEEKSRKSLSQSNKNNRDEFVGVYIREQFWLENSLSQSEGGGTGKRSCPSRNQKYTQQLSRSLFLGVKGPRLEIDYFSSSAVVNNAMIYTPNRHASS